jgi:hypothetical protein
MTATEWNEQALAKAPAPEERHFIEPRLEGGGGMEGCKNQIRSKSHLANTKPTRLPPGSPPRVVCFDVLSETMPCSHAQWHSFPLFQSRGILICLTQQDCESTIAIFPKPGRRWVRNKKEPQLGPRTDFPCCFYAGVVVVGVPLILWDNVFPLQ